MKLTHISVLNFLFLLLSTAFFSSCEKKDIDLESFVPKNPELVMGYEQRDVKKVDSTYKVRVQSNLPWRAKSNAEWIVLNDSTDAGIAVPDSVIKFKVAKNPVTTPRSGTISVWITSDYQKVITINQEAGDPPPIVKRNVYVKVGGTGNGDSWANATSLSTALAIDLAPGDFIHIAAGTYNPQSTITGGLATAAGDKTFEIKQNIVLIGGYPANATTGAISNPSVNTTTLDGNSTANHVVTIAAPAIADQKVLLKGITIKNGNAIATGSVTINALSYPRNSGGGAIVIKANAEFENCSITDNKSGDAGAGGAGIFGGTSSTITLRNTLVQNNFSGGAVNGGGIVLNTQSILYAYHSTIADNGAGGFAGGIYQWTGSCYLYNTTVSGNGAGGLGSTITGKAYGGVYIRDASGEFVNCTFSGNTASNVGGALGIVGSATIPALLNMVSCTVTGNLVKSGSAGGAGIQINAATGVTVTIHNSIFSGNTKGTTGVETPSNIEGATGFTYTKFNTIVGAQVFDNSGNAVSGATFDFATMLGPLANNGGSTKTIKLMGSGNPALNNGMTAAQLTTRGNALIVPVPASISTFDQVGESRSTKPYIGALVKQ